MANPENTPPPIRRGEVWFPAQQLRDGTTDYRGPDGRLVRAGEPGNLLDLLDLDKLVSEVD